jgi:glucose/arabinose dehydrogenase
VAYIREFSNKEHEAETVNKLQNTVSTKGYTIERSLSGEYFPIPAKVTNAVKSETQVFMVDTVKAGLTMPWSFIFLPDKSTLIAQRSGKLIRMRDGKVVQDSIIGTPKELRDIKLHPQFEKNHLLYFSCYIDPVKEKKTGGYTVLMRGKLEGDKLIDTQELYRAGPFKENAFWYGSKIVFDKDGYLYFAVGQRTIDGRHRWKTVQEKDNPSGKVMRFKDDGSIPPDNPFVDSANALPEIYTYGHRQPEGMLYDARTGKIWETEHGEMGGCELNVLQKGGNYGWPDVTYSLNYDGTIISKDTTRPGMVSPVHYWIPSIAPGGLDVVYDSKYTGWNGNIFVSSLVQKMVNRTAFKNNKAVHDEKLLQGIGRVRDVKFGPDHMLYVLTEDTGILVRLIPLAKK